MILGFIPQIKAFKDFGAAVPYKSVVNDVIVSVNPNQLTAVLEVHCSSINDTDIMQSSHDRLMKQFCELPDDCTVSVYYSKIFIDENIPVMGKHENALVNYLEEKRIQHLLKVNAPTNSCFVSISIPFNVNKEEFGLINKFLDVEAAADVQNNEAFKKTFDTLNKIIKTMVAAMTGYGVIYRLNSADIIKFISLLLNHSYLDLHSHLCTIFTSDIIASLRGMFSSRIGYVYYGGNYHAVMSLRNAQKDSKLPESSDASLNNIFLHKDLANIPFTIHQAIHFPSKSKGIARAKLRSNMITVRGSIAKFLPFLSKTPEGIQPEILKQLITESIEHISNSSERFLEQHFHIHVWGSSLTELQERCETFTSAVSSVYKLKQDKLNLKCAFYSLFPGNETCNTIRSTLPSFNVADFMPIDMPRYCYPGKTKDFIYYHTMVDSLVRISPFDKRADNWNALIVGGSGSGKSFLSQDILWQYSVYNPQIAIVDYGGADAGSYRNFVLNMRGVYLEIGFGMNAMPFSINPFEGELFDENGTTNPEKLTMLLRTIELMVSQGKGDRLDGVVSYELQLLLKSYYTRKGNNQNNDCNLNEFAQQYLKDNFELKAAHRELYKELFHFIGTGEEEGAYARFFRSSTRLEAKDVVCFDLEGLKGHERLKNVLVVALLDLITYRILGSADKDRRKLVVMDEAWKDLKGGDMADFMENCSRTIRKLNGQITIISQRLGDIMDSSIGKALLANTSYFYFVGSKHEHKPSHNPSERYTPLEEVTASSSAGNQKLSEYDIDTILNQQSKRDFYLLTPFFCGQLRFYPSAEFMMVATTDPDEKRILRRHMKSLGHNYVTPEVMEAAKNEFAKK